MAGEGALFPYLSGYLHTETGSSSDSMFLLPSTGIPSGVLTSLTLPTSNNDVNMHGSLRADDQDAMHSDCTAPRYV